MTSYIGITYVKKKKHKKEEGCFLPTPTGDADGDAAAPVMQWNGAPTGPLSFKNAGGTVTYISPHSNAPAVKWYLVIS